MEATSHAFKANAHEALTSRQAAGKLIVTIA